MDVNHLVNKSKRLVTNEQSHKFRFLKGKWIKDIEIDK